VVKGERSVRLNAAQGFKAFNKKIRDEYKKATAAKPSGLMVNGTAGVGIAIQNFGVLTTYRLP
jgi:aldehyde:ferredoxin oxidoreductase